MGEVALQQESTPFAGPFYTGQTDALSLKTKSEPDLFITDFIFVPSLSAKKEKKTYLEDKTFIKFVLMRIGF